MKVQTSTQVYDINKTVIPVNFTSTASTVFPFGSYGEKQYVGMALALGGNLLISISLSVQKKAHNR